MSDNEDMEVKNSFLGLWIPRAILDIPNIDPVDKMTYAHIEGLGGASTTGCFASKKYIADRLGVPERTVSRSLKALRDSGLIYPDGFRKRVRVYRCTGKYVIDRSGSPSWAIMAEDRGPQWRTESKEESKDDNTSVRSHKDGEYTSDFDTFWSAYPRRIGKKKAYRCWLATLNKGASAAQLHNAVGNYKMRCAADRTEERFIKHPATFLGPDEHWRDFEVSSHPSASPENRVVKLKTTRCPKGHIVEVGGICRECGYDTGNQG